MKLNTYQDCEKHAHDQYRIPVILKLVSHMIHLSINFYTKGNRRGSNKDNGQKKRCCIGTKNKSPTAEKFLAWSQEKATLMQESHHKTLPII